MNYLNAILNAGVYLCLSSLTYKKEQKHHDTNLTAISRNEYGEYVIVQKLFYSITDITFVIARTHQNLLVFLLYYTLSIEN